VIFFPKRQEAQAGKFQSQKATAIARIMASSSEAGLNFADAAAVRETLKGLRRSRTYSLLLFSMAPAIPSRNIVGPTAGRSSHQSAICWQRTIQSRESRQRIAGKSASRARAARVRFLSSDTHLVAIAPILSDGKQLGSVALGIDQTSCTRRYPAAVFGRWRQGS